MLLWNSVLILLTGFFTAHCGKANVGFSFGNYTRMDYGTGHELHFVAWLFLLCTIGYFTPRDHMALVIRVFTKFTA